MDMQSGRPQRTTTSSATTMMMMMNGCSAAASLSQTTATTPLYKSVEKRWRRLSEKEVLADAELLQVRSLRPEQQALVKEVGSWTAPDGRQRPVLAFDALGSAHEGFFVIPDAIDAATQLETAHACLTEYIEAPHVTNMHLQDQQVQGLWRQARHQHPSDPAKAPALSKLHWGAAGYHYDWTARKYHAGNFSPVPSRLEALGATCANACGLTLRAEAVIVNFYKKSSTMGGHQDDVEYTMDHPVVSLSLGSRCVFLKGGTTKDEAPLSVLLQSGDIAILSGASRLSFHGVAKILPSPFEIKDTELSALVEKQKTASSACDDGVEDWEDELRAVRTYLGTHRVNINIRQVFADHTTDASRARVWQSQESESREEEEAHDVVHETHASVAPKRQKTSN